MAVVRRVFMPDYRLPVLVCACRSTTCAGDALANILTWPCDRLQMCEWRSQLSAFPPDILYDSRLGFVDLFGAVGVVMNTIKDRAYFNIRQSDQCAWVCIYRAR